VRGLVEHGGRKSPQPTLFRLGEDRARYESVQQFLADAGCLCEQAAGFAIPQTPVLADQAYGDDAAFRTGLHEAGLEYVLAVGPETGVFGPETSFAVPKRRGRRGRPPSVPRPDRKPESVKAVACRLPAEAWTTLPCRTTPAGEEAESRFAFLRVVASHPVLRDHKPPRFEWLVIE
jgi:peptidoglycan hydrolase-like protein with peptidoglycan-binding domain